MKRTSCINSKIISHFRPGKSKTPAKSHRTLYKQNIDRSPTFLRKIYKKIKPWIHQQSLNFKLRSTDIIYSHNIIN